MTHDLVGARRVARSRARALLVGGLFLLVSCANTPPAMPPMPEAASGLTSKPGWFAQRFMVTAANPLAADAGQWALRAGGNAMDAAVAMQMVLALVEPQSSGLGGGAFLLHWDGGSVAAWDGRETAPAAVNEALFLRADGKPMGFEEARIGGRPVGVPGVVRMLEAAHRVHGRLPWASLMQPALTWAEQGFRLSPRLHALLVANPALRGDALARAYFFGADGQPLPVGTLLRNPAFADVLRSLATRGGAALHEGPLAVDIVRRVQAHSMNPGQLTLADLAGYQPRRREAICTDWKTLYRVCGFPPPSSGHLTVMQILGLLERLPADTAPLRGGAPGADWLHLYLEASRLAFADRAQYVADPDFVAAPTGRWTSLLDGDYLRQRAALVGPLAARSAMPGTPAGVATAQSVAPAPVQPEFGTTHFSIVDADGHAVAMTSSVEYAFGAHLMSDGGSGKAGGFLLNNQLTDFAWLPRDAAGNPVANRVQAGKRPRSSMSPTLVFDRRDGRLLMSLGSSGGAAIIHFTAKTLIATLDWGLDAQRAIDLPNFGNFNGPDLLESGRFPAATLDALRARGHVLANGDMASGIQAIQRMGRGWHGGADPRREGVARGE